MLQGPAGSGNSTTLVAWRQALLPLGFDVASLTLTPEDNEPTRLFDYLLASLAQAAPAVTQEAADFAGRGIDSEAVERTLIALVRSIAAHSRDLVLVLDDLHHLGDARIHEALQWLVDYAPSNLHLVLASRGAVPLSLERLRAESQVLELDVRDLRFSPAESERFLQSHLGRIEHRDAMLLHELSEGWAAGLQLLAINWKKRRQELAGSDAAAPGDFVRSQVQDPKSFAAYFEKAVLSHLSQSELDLLISASARRIEALIARIETRGRQRLVAQLKLMRAVIERRRGRPDAARDCTLAALRSGHRLGLVRSLLDADPSVPELVAEIAKDASLDPVLAFYAERLGRAARPPEGAAAALASAETMHEATKLPVEPLSERERDVLALLAQAMPNKKIALAIGLSIDTVKWHLKNIYGKLGVAGRDEAVAWMRVSAPTGR